MEVQRRIFGREKGVEGTTTPLTKEYEKKGKIKGNRSILVMLNEVQAEIFQSHRFQRAVLGHLLFYNPYPSELQGAENSWWELQPQWEETRTALLLAANPAANFSGRVVHAVSLTNSLKFSTNRSEVSRKGPQSSECFSKKGAIFCNRDL